MTVYNQQSARSISKKLSSGILPKSPSSLFRTEMLLLATSFSPTTTIKGSLSILALLIL